MTNSPHQPGPKKLTKAEAQALAARLRAEYGIDEPDPLGFEEPPDRDPASYWTEEEQAAFEARNPPMQIPDWDDLNEAPPPKEETAIALMERLEREQYEAFHRGGRPNGEARPNGRGEKPVEPFEGIDAATLKGQQTPREFLDRAEIFPKRNVALFSGEGAIGKSLMILQLAIACTTNTQWMDVDVAQCPVLYFSCEDDKDEVANRLNGICNADGIDLAVVIGRLIIIDMVGKDSVLAESVGKDGKLKATPVFERLVRTIEHYRPGLLILDGLADVFAGNENNRSHAKQFITLLRGVSIRFDLVALLIGHPSLTGMLSGSGMSGSTAWNNAVRVRAYLQKTTGADADKNERIFEVMKANYSAPGNIRWPVKWDNGRLVRTEATSAFDRITINDLERVKDRFRVERWRTSEQAQQWGGYVVAEILDWDIGSGAAKNRTNEQNRNRADIRTYLSRWVAERALYTVFGQNAKRETVQYFSTKPPD